MSEIIWGDAIDSTVTMTWDRMCVSQFCFEATPDHRVNYCTRHQRTLAGELFVMTGRVFYGEWPAIDGEEDRWASYDEIRDHNVVIADRGEMLYVEIFSVLKVQPVLVVDSLESFDQVADVIDRLRKGAYGEVLVGRVS